MAKTRDESEWDSTVIDRVTGPAAVSVREAQRASEAPAAERRIKPRYAVSLRVTLHGDHNFYLGLSENISEGGLFVRTQKVLPIGTQIRVEFTLPLHPTPVSVTGEVRWVRQADTGRAEGDNYGTDEDRAGMGIQFMGLEPEVARSIKRFIAMRAPEFYVE